MTNREIKMLQKFHNILLLYSLLLIDLLVNITDSLLTSPSYIVFDKKSKHLEFVIDGWTFIIFIIQITAIAVVILSLVLRFFTVSDHIKNTAWLQEIRAKSPEGDTRILKAAPLEPMPQRLALKLVLEKYWWSMLVGLLYLVLTIILQIIRLDPSWHPNRYYSQQEVRNRDPMIGSEDTLTLSTLFGDGEHSFRSLLVKRDYRSDTRDSIVEASHPRRVLPILIVLTHKLMSTCYYVSFVVAHRATTDQMVSRILLPSDKID